MNKEIERLEKEHKDKFYERVKNEIDGDSNKNKTAHKYFPRCEVENIIKELKTARSKLKRFFFLSF